MNERENSTNPDFDPDTAPDLSRDGWPEKFAKVPVHRGSPSLGGSKQSTVIRLSQEVTMGAKK